MPIRRNRNYATLATKSTELAIAVPKVVAHRMARMVMAGPVLSGRDRKEFQRMGAEKMAAFSEAWAAMTLQVLRANQNLLASSLTTFWSPWDAMNAMAGAATHFHNLALAVLGDGIAPAHRRATANAKRLARTRLR